MGEDVIPVRPLLVDCGAEEVDKPDNEQDAEQHQLHSTNDKLHILVFSDNPVRDQSLDGQADDGDDLPQQVVVRERGVLDPRQVGRDGELERHKGQHPGPVQSQAVANEAYIWRHRQGKARDRCDHVGHQEDLDDVEPLLALDAQDNPEARGVGGPPAQCCLVFWNHNG
eukprot:CAMPEP_0179062372 /NCGR_PEP_ID=MMETSP0796-20121207/26895_1 /TAXON_ID=73915 /ORGANISM="Pyrodinium bahamense, Strain pbaha01" /LENGTH=168 /DNA_ID=CAMNT_0020759279 /DNA_START=227 /DNA_END=733 /DNA_ORIENTATION=+